MKIILEVNISHSKAGMIEEPLKQLAENINAENLQFLAEQSKKPNVNETLAKRKGLIKAAI